MTKGVRLYQVDAFTTRRFSGNPAAVCILEDEISDNIMQQIAAEMNLSETAFVRRLPSAAEGEYSLRWFTPAMEVPLCGHATVATAAALLEGEGVQCSELRFQTVHCGVLTVTRESGLYHLSVPLLAPGHPHSSVAQPCDAISKVIMGSLPGAHCLYTGHCGKSKYVFLALEGLEAGQLESMAAPTAELRSLPGCDGIIGVIVSCAGHDTKTRKVFMALEGLTREQFEQWDPPIAQLKGTLSSIDDIRSVIVSCAGGDGQPELLVRFFAPWAGIDEDPVTGSAYAVAGPWWASKLGKSSFAARQCSKRGGDLHITVSEADGRVDVAGGAVVISEGRLFLD